MDRDRAGRLAGVALLTTFGIGAVAGAGFEAGRRLQDETPQLVPQVPEVYASEEQAGTRNSGYCTYDWTTEENWRALMNSEDEEMRERLRVDQERLSELIDVAGFTEIPIQTEFPEGPIPGKIASWGESSIEEDAQRILNISYNIRYGLGGLVNRCTYNQDYPNNNLLYGLNRISVHKRFIDEGDVYASYNITDKNARVFARTEGTAPMKYILFQTRISDPKDPDKFTGGLDLTMRADSRVVAEARRRGKTSIDGTPFPILLLVEIAQ